MKGLIHCKEHDWSFGQVRKNPSKQRVNNLAQHLWSAHDIESRHAQYRAQDILTGEADFPAAHGGANDNR